MLAGYALGQAYLLWCYFRTRQHAPVTPPLPAVLPVVTVQLPLYNEKAVVARLLNAVLALEYPRHLLEIQVLDDSTDETSALIARLIAPYVGAGWRIQHVRRPHREGYKAGALAYGLARAEGEFVAIFDADFTPPKDFLLRTLPHLLADEGLAMVQTRWGHWNADDNALTAAQRLSMDAHFTLEQTARARAGLLVPFNGTGGIWRTTAIHDAGGWSAETLTEDCDLSIRAQLRGWRALYLPDVVVAGEVPPQLAAYRQQQARWAQGNSECLRLHARELWRTPTLSLRQRIMATHQMGQYLPQVWMFITLLLLPMLVMRDVSLSLAPLGIVSLIAPAMYLTSQHALYRHVRHVWAFPVLALLGMGLTARNTWAVVRAFLGLKGEFKRTPKFSHRWQESAYALPHHTALPEAFLLAYSLWGAALAYQHESPFLPYLLLYALAFALVVVWEAVDAWRLQRPRTAHRVRVREG
jgi:cellulose synthase/poly-beta-1,6-N-acetylglucosamine synthase-like glycosyltransferase